jgi:hypothetical protein
MLAALLRAFSYRRPQAAEFSLSFKKTPPRPSVNGEGPPHDCLHIVTVAVRRARGPQARELQVVRVRQPSSHPFYPAPSAVEITSCANIKQVSANRNSLPLVGSASDGAVTKDSQCLLKDGTTRELAFCRTLDFRELVWQTAA